MTTEDTSSEVKAPRIRSVAYPSITVAEAIELTTTIYKIFGNITFTSREAIAKNLYISESNLQTKISSCVQYGLIELKTKEGYRPTELFIKVRSPLPDEKSEEILASIFSNPELYKALIEQFNGKQLPQEAGLATILYRKLKVADKASGYAAKIFIQSAIELGYLSDEGVLNIGITQNQYQEIDDKKLDVKNENQVLYLPARTEPTVDEIEKSEIPPIPIFLDNGTIAKLYMPKGFTKQDLIRVAKVVNAYVE